MDQAAGLRELLRQRNSETYRNFRRQMRKGVQVLAVTSGKGGVGKSNFVANVAVALAQRGERVVIMDADFGLANIDVLFGLSPRWNLGHVMRGEKSFADILVHAPHGVLLVPAASGVQEMAEMNVAQRQEMMSELARLDLETDYLLIDTASGIAQNVTHVLTMADEVIVVTTPEPTALVDAYAVIKLVVGESESKVIRVVVNQVERETDAQFVVDELNNITRQFLNRDVQLLGGIAKDDALLQSVQSQLSIFDYAPESPAGRNYREVADRLRRSRKVKKTGAESPAVLGTLLRI